jgi:tetratricopeptide (TPR) repeat protein
MLTWAAMGVPEIDEITKKRTERLCDAGFTHLRNGDFEAALEVAAELEKIGYTAAFDIAAQAHAAAGDLDRAVTVLERGLALVPDAWPNWQLLGNYRSDLGLHDQAAEAYARALDCPDTWQAAIRLNQAILLSRMERHEEALGVLEQADDPELDAELGDARLHALVRLGRSREAADLAQSILCDPELEGVDPALLARVIGNLARARWQLGAPIEEVRELSLEALEMERNDPGALELLRELEPLRSDRGQFLRLVLHARIPAAAGAEMLGFYASYDVVADDAHEALQFIRALEHDDVLGLVEISELTVVEPCPGQLKGVYARSDRVYYDSVE